MLADEPRVGKTGSAIMAADYVMAENILVITTSSGRPVWRRAFDQWSPFGRRVQIVDGKKPLDAKTQVAIVGWGSVTNPSIRSQLLRRKWDLVIPDESHFAKNFDAKRTQALYGELRDGGKHLDNNHALASDQTHIWPLSGTPAPNSPFDFYPMLRALRPFCLEAHDGMPDVTKEQDFLHRYCVVRMKKVTNFRKIPVVVGGRNADELKRRIGGFMLRRTQKDVGIREPIYETFPLAAPARLLSEVNASIDETKIAKLRGKKTISEDDLKAIELDLAQMRRLTGGPKARAMVEAVKDEFDCGLDKIVLAYWHRDVGAILKEGLAAYGVVGIDGSTPAHIRGEAEQRFLHDPKIRVFLGQIQAAGEAIDLSSAALLVFVETSIVPKDMKQMSLRITNHTQTRQPIVRVAVLEGSIDETLENILLRKWSAIRDVLT